MFISLHFQVYKYILQHYAGVIHAFTLAKKNLRQKSVLGNSQLG